MAIDIVYSSESTKKFEAVLFAVDQSYTAQSIAWYVFKDKNAKTSIIPYDTTIEFCYKSHTGEPCTTGLLPINAINVWTIEDVENDVSFVEGNN